MKRIIFTGIVIFSFALNAAVAATIGWHFWNYRHWEKEADRSFAATAALTGEDLQNIRQMWTPDARLKMMEMRKSILAKNAEVIDAISRRPGNMAAADKEINELLALRGQMEREAYTRMSTILASLPADRREAFTAFVRNRCCMGPGMGMGRGMGMGPGYGPRRMAPCPVQAQ